MILDRGDKVLVAHRRLYDGDAPRYFLGTVLDCFEGVAKVEGRSFVFDAFTGKILRKQGSTRKIVSLSSGTLIVYHLDDDVDLDRAEFKTASRGQIILTDGKHLEVDLTEPARPAL